MKYSAFFLLLLFSINATGQKLQSNVEFTGNKVLVLLAKKEALQAPGKLSSGDIIKVGCGNNGCYFRIEYKGREIEKSIGDDITVATIYEYDFAGDGDYELVVVNDFKKTSFIYIYSYSRGIIQELFEKEILYNRTVLKKDYIEYYGPGGEDLLWNYYQGHFWLMTPYENKKIQN